MRPFRDPTLRFRDSSTSLTPARESAAYDSLSLLNSQPSIMTIIDPQTYRVVLQNKLGVNKYGNILNEPCHRKIGGGTSPCSFCRFPETLETGKITSKEVLFPNNQWLLFQWAKVITLDGQEQIIETITDITTQKEKEETLRQAQKMDAIGQLAGGIAHDFNNLLTIIRGCCDELLQNTAMDVATRSGLEEIRRTGGRASALTQKLLAFSRRKSLQPCSLDFNTILSEMKTMLQRLLNESIEITINSGENLGQIWADRDQIEHMLINLVLNAKDAMPNGGEILIETQNRELDRTFAKQHRGAVPGDYIQLTVKDSGCGMDAETLKHIFEPFFTTKQVGKGSGLGLAMVYGFLKQSGGYIDAVSEVGKGSTFTVYFPRVENPVPLEIIPPQLPQVRGGQETVMVVEDEISVRTIISMVLKGRGYRVLEAASGNEALDVFQNQHKPIDLVISDFTMPRMNGQELVQRLRQQKPDLKVLYISGYTWNSLNKGSLTESTDFLQKPFGADDISLKVRTLLDA